MNLKIGLALLPAALIVAGCQPDAPSTKLRQEVEQLKRKLEDIESQMTLLRRDVLRASLTASRGATAYLTPASGNYSVAKTELGSLAIALKDVKAYANGSKITLEVGNPLSTRINGLTAKIEWGKLDKDGLAVTETIKSREITFANSLRLGSWSREDVVLEGLAPADLGYVELSQFGHRGIELLK